MTKLWIPFAALSLALPAAAAEWKLDPTHTNVGFSVQHMMVSDVVGSFDKYTGNIVIDDKDVTKSTATIEIDATSINTKDEKRDKHLKAGDFFDAEKHPKITFKSTKIEKGSAANSYKVTGDITIRGVTKPLTLDVVLSDEWTDPKEWGGNVHRGVKATGKVNRQDFGMKWQTKLDKGGVVVGDEVTLMVNAELIKVQPAPPKK